VIVREKTTIKSTFTFKGKSEFKYTLKRCKSIDAKSLSIKVLQELLKKDKCSKFNIEVSLYNKQSDSSSFKINNCNIEINE